MTLARFWRSMMSVCFLVGVSGQPPAPIERITFTARRSTRDAHRTGGYEFQWAIGGVVQQRSRDAAFGGVLPLGIRMFGGRLSLDGGVVLASARVPAHGTAAH